MPSYKYKNLLLETSRSEYESGYEYDFQTAQRWDNQGKRAVKPKCRHPSQFFRCCGFRPTIPIKNPWDNKENNPRPNLQSLLKWEGIVVRQDCLKSTLYRGWWGGDEDKDPFQKNSRVIYCRDCNSWTLVTFDVFCSTALGIFYVEHSFSHYSCSFPPLVVKD